MLFFVWYNKTKDIMQTQSITLHQEVLPNYNNSRVSIPNRTLESPLFEEKAKVRISIENRYDILTDAAASEMSSGTIPNLSKICMDLYETFFNLDNVGNALQFMPVMNEIHSLSPNEVNRFMQNPVTNHVLVRNALMKVVLIHWKPGRQSDIHGHAKGGCLFKVLQGKVVENRYRPDGSETLLSTTTCRPGNMAYIDDSMAHHAVGNPFAESCISLHVYTPGL